MRQLDVYAHPDRAIARSYPYLIVLQSSLVSETQSVIAAPLVRQAPAGRLYPRVMIDGEEFAVMMSDLAAVPRSRLHRPVANLDSERHRIIAALDLLFTGV